MPEIPAVSDQRQITAILPVGIGHEVLEQLSLTRGLTTATLHRARGMGIVPLIGKGGVGAQVEWDLLSVIVPADQADEIFEFVFNRGQVDRPHGGFVYMGRLDSATPFVLPEVAAAPETNRESATE